MSKALTEKRLLNIALFYLGQYETSEKKLRQVLTRRVTRMKTQGTEIPPEAKDWIEAVIAHVREQGYLNNDRYAAAQVRVLVGEGRSDRYILMKLKASGIPENTVKKLLEESGVSERDRADRYAQKKKVGPYRPQTESPDRKRELGVMASAGFPYDIAVSVLGTSPAPDEE